MNALLLLSILACSGPADDSAEPADTDTDTDTDTDADTDTQFLEAGDYAATLLASENDTCNGFLELRLARSYELVWVDDTRFTLDDHSIVEGCTVDGESATCDGYDVPLGPLGADAEGSLTVSTPFFERESSTAFNRVELVELSCTGSGCADVETTLGLTFPCAIEGVEEYQK